jgi:hypothetical protein
VNASSFRLKAEAWSFRLKAEATGIFVVAADSLLTTDILFVASAFRRKILGA